MFYVMLSLSPNVVYRWKIFYKLPLYNRKFSIYFDILFNLAEINFIGDSCSERA